jgi:beta-N-acetylhexosaminidase
MSFPLIISIKSSQISKLERENIKKYKPFGVILFKRNILNLNQTKKLIKSIKSLHPKIHILIDQEGGIVNRFPKLNEFNFFDNFDYYQTYLKLSFIS